jgi:hypothetical protein
MTEPAHPSIDVQASCACGAVTMRITGRVGSMFMCACLHCQQATGTGHSAVALVAERYLTVTGQIGSFARQSASGASFSRNFCPCCATPLFGGSSRAPGICLVSAGFFAGNNSWFQPGQLIFARTRQGWDAIADHLPRHDTYRQETD